MSYQADSTDEAWRTHCDSRLLGMRVNRYSWWTHWRELAEYELPRRYKWLITPNQMNRGSQINQHILDSTGTICARNLAAGMMYGISPPTRPWFRLRIGKIDSTFTNPVSLWLAQVEHILLQIFQQSNFYQSLAVFYFDLVIFGTGTILIYEDFDNVINCINPCLGEYYLDNDGKQRPRIFYSECTKTIAQVVDQFGYDNCSDNVRRTYDEGSGRNGAAFTREIVVAHAIEPNDGDRFGVAKQFEFRECFWEYGGSTGGTQQVGAKGFLRKKGYFENPSIPVRWDLVSNDPYGRSPGMDGLPDIKQLQLETRRKAQGVDKVVNPPMLADVQLKNQPASLLPGGMTYIAGMMANNHPGMISAYGNWRPDIKTMVEDLAEVRTRISKIFFNDILRPISQFETRSNVTAVEIDQRKAEALVMLGPVLERIMHEGAKNWINRSFNIAKRSGILPPAPAELSGKNIDVEFVSILETAQDAAAASGIERLLGLTGNLAAIDPGITDNVDFDFGLNQYSKLLNNDPRLIRSPEALASIRQRREQQQAQQQRVEQAEKLAAGAKTLSETDTGAGKNALQQMTGL